MLNRRQESYLLHLESLINSLKKRKRSRDRERRLCDSFRAVIRFYQNVASLNPKWDDDLKRLRLLAFQAMNYLGGEGDIHSTSLKEYEHKRYGPYLGVSDEGSAAPVIRMAALSAPKTVAFGTIDPIIVGVAVDAERLGGIGEVAVGPEEYINVRLDCAGRILSSTNVGTRINMRFYRRYPTVSISGGNLENAISHATRDIRILFEPYLRTPGGKRRPLLIFVEFDKRNRWKITTRIHVLQQLVSYINNPKIADTSIHRLGYRARIGWGERGKDAAIRSMEVAKAAGIKEVAIDGVVRKLSDEYLSYPGLLSYLAPGMLGPVLRKANELGILIRPVNPVDPETVARHVWSSLHTARQMGYELGKYGLFPLTLEESDAVVQRIQSWYSDWTAAPVFFVDQGLVSATRVDTHGDLLRGLKTWLRMVAKHKVPVVLIDTIEKVKKHLSFGRGKSRKDS